MDKNLKNICGVIELVSILTLSGMGFYSLIRCSKIEKKLRNEEIKNFFLECHGKVQEAIIETLERQLKAETEKEEI